MLLTLMMLTGCNRYWFDVAEVSLGTLNLKPGVISVEDSGYRLDPESHAAFTGLVWVDSLDGEQEWNQVNVELEWTVASAAEGNVQRPYGVSLWDLNNYVGDDTLLLNGSANLDALEVDANAPSTQLMMSGSIAAPTDGSLEMPFALGIMVENVSPLDEDYALSGGATLRLIVNGRDDRGSHQPIIGLTLDE